MLSNNPEIRKRWTLTLLICLNVHCFNSNWCRYLSYTFMYLTHRMRIIKISCLRILKSLDKFRAKSKEIRVYNYLSICLITSKPLHICIPNYFGSANQLGKSSAMCAIFMIENSASFLSSYWSVGESLFWFLFILTCGYFHSLWRCLLAKFKLF